MTLDDFFNNTKRAGRRAVEKAGPHSPDCWLVSQITSGNLIVDDRKECLTPDNPMILFDEGSLRRILASYVEYYHRSRTHLALAKDSPESRPVQPPDIGPVIAVLRVGGLHHRYERRAA